MAWSNIPSLLEKVWTKFVPTREEGIRNKINKLEKEKDELVKSPFTVHAAARYDKLSNEIDKLKKSLQNR